MSNRLRYTLAFLVGLIVLGGFLLLRDSSETSLQDQSRTSTNGSIEGASSQLLQSGLTTDFSQSSIDLSLVLNGGPGKDGIPALTNPDFVEVSEARVNDDTQVMVVQNNGEVKIYPYNILVWHEIVNDDVGGTPLAITFCPLCGSAIVFERELEGEVLDFGVSGFLYESNMIMYSRENSESLFSQSLGEAVIGERTGQELAVFPLELLTYEQAAEQYPTALVLSDDTGFPRDYSSNPYGDYDETEQLYFQVSNTDQRFPAKELFYIVPLGGESLAVQLDQENGEYPVPDTDVRVVFDNGSVKAFWGTEELPGYYEMWFSWATHNQETGIVLSR